MKSQTAAIKADLEEGKKITPLYALHKYGSMRLSARINNLRDAGMHIVTTIIKQNGKRFAEYSLINKQ